jgi:hypothetical protein
MIWFSIIGLIIQLITNWPEISARIGEIIDAIRNRPKSEQRIHFKRLAVELKAEMAAREEHAETSKKSKKPIPMSVTPLENFLTDLKKMK